MENIDLINSFLEFREEKNINQMTMMSILEDVFRMSLKKKYGSDENFDIIVNLDKGDLEIWRNRVVVEDGKVENENEEISLSQARKIEPDFEIGEDVSEEIKINQLGRRAVLNLRQNLISRIYEYDNSNLYKKFKDLEGHLYTAEVHHIKRTIIILLDEQGNELILPKTEQIHSDFFRKGSSVKGIIKKVELNENKPVIVLSRSSPEFLKKLFEREVPEIFDGLIIIKGIARIPGEKAKVAVDTYDDRVDPVGACVGMKGSRIHSIVRELGNENIDVINYTKNQELYISRALNPAKVVKIELFEGLDGEKKRANVYLNPEEVSKAIGRNGVNIRLASQLTGYEIEILRDGLEDDEDVELTEFSDEIEPWIIEAFKNTGLDTAKSILEKEVEELESRTDLEKETIIEIKRILKSEFEN